MYHESKINKYKNIKPQPSVQITSKKDAKMIVNMKKRYRKFRQYYKIHQNIRQIKCLAKTVRQTKIQTYICQKKMQK